MNPTDPAARRRRLQLAGAAALGIAALLAWWWWPRETAPLFTTATVDRGDVALRITASGTLSATVTVDVGSQVTGRIQDLYVDFNSVVKKGQVVARIDPSIYQAQAAQARANVSAARGNLARTQAQAEDAQRQARRAAELAEQKLLAQSDADTADSNARVAVASVQQARGQLEQAQASLLQSETSLRYTEIISPTDGVVISRAVSQGQTVSASLSAPVLFTIAQDLREMQVQAAVAEADIGRLQPGMKASFSVDAFPGERFDGNVREIRNAATVTNNVVTYVTVIDVRNSDLKLKPGMTANVSFIAARADDVLRVPNAALRFKPAPELLARLGLEAAADAAAARTRANGDERRGRGGARAAGGGNGGRVWVLDAGEPRPLPVQTGLSDGSFTEIRSAELGEGAVVITGSAASTSTDKRPPMMF